MKNYLRKINNCVFTTHLEMSLSLFESGYEHAQSTRIDHDDGSLNSIFRDAKESRGESRGLRKSMEPTEDELEEWVEQQLSEHYSTENDKAIAAIAEHDHRIFAQWAHFLMSIGELSVTEETLLNYAGELTAFGIDTHEDFVSPDVREQDFVGMGIPVAHRDIIAKAINKKQINI